MTDPNQDADQQSVSVSVLSLTRRGLLAAIGVSGGVLIAGGQYSRASALQGAAGGMVYPTDPWIYTGEDGQAYLDPRPGRLHMGSDAQGGVNQPIFAVAAGRVVAGQWGTTNRDAHGWGNYVKIAHASGFETLYAHFSAQPLVSPGSVVSTGQQIGRMGGSGYGNLTAYDRHLHFEAFKGGANVDPIRFLKGDFGTPIVAPQEENDMYDAAAQQALFRKIENDTRPIRLYSWGTGLIAVGPGGKEWVVPSQAYVDLLVFLRLCGPEAVSINTDQKNFLKMISGLLNPDPNVNAQAGGVMSLSPDEAERLARDLPQNA